MKKMINYFLMGVGLGSFIYLINLLVFHFSPSWSNSLVTWLASGLMGLAALIYEHPKWSDPVKITINLLTIYILVMAMIFSNHWVPFELGYILGVSLQFLLIYLLIAGFFAWQNKNSVHRINQKLADQKNKS